MQISHPTPTELCVLITVLHAGSEHCDGGGDGAAEDRVLPLLLLLVAEVEVVGGERFFFRRAHSPSRTHLWALSVRCSRQYVPRQDSHRKGRKSSWLQ